MKELEEVRLQRSRINSLANSLELDFMKSGGYFYIYRPSRDITNNVLFKSIDLNEIEDFLNEHFEDSLQVGKFKEVEGDLIKLAKQGKFDAIAHGCNCFATMGAGIAVEIKKNFRSAYIADQSIKLDENERLGNLSYGTKGKLTVFNLYSQFMPGRSLDKDALALSLSKMARHMRFNEPNRKEIGLPLIGCGIGGGNWEEVKRIIQEKLYDFNVTIVHFKN